MGLFIAGLGGVSEGDATLDWNGTISFGMVNVPVKLYSAIESTSIHFHEVHSVTRMSKEELVAALAGEE